jgi:trehalose 6-phosphate phosphatase
MSPPLPLWSYLEGVLQRCRSHDCCALLLDFDGTLTPIVPHPEAAHLSPTMQELLGALAAYPSYRVAIVSGRALADLQPRIAASGLYLAGNHGLEIEGPGGRYDHPEAQRLRPQMTALAHDLRADLAEIPQALVEDKGVTLSVHYRQVPASFVPEVRARLLKRTGRALEAGVLALRTGKAVLEIRPSVPWGKGEAVHWIVERLYQDMPGAHMLALYLGDDDTDEDAFRAIASSGIGIVVGRDRLHSAAPYYVQSVEEVERFLSTLRGRIRGE